MAPTTVMNKAKILGILLLVLISGCKRIMPKDSSLFLVEEASIPVAYSRPKIVKEGDSEKIIYISDNKRSLLKSDFVSGHVDTLVAGTHQKIIDFCFNESDGSVFCLLWDWSIVDNRSGAVLTCPRCDNNGIECQWEGLQDYKPFMVDGNLIYTGLMPTGGFINPEYDILPFYRDCLNIGIWRKDSNNTVIFEKSIGQKPSDQPNFYVDDCYQTAFNLKKSIIVAGTELSECVLAFDIDGKWIGEQKMTSFLYKKPDSASFEANRSANKKIQYWKTNALFRGIYYDKYRNLYYRVLILPEQIENTFVKHKQNWVLIVADSVLSKKYEVLVNGDEYKPSLLIGQKGVYIEKNEKMDLFVFD